VLLYSLYGGDLHGKVDTWFLLAMPLFYFLARMFDELDGKQARRTGNSSPLGLLLDHGCDAFTSALLTFLMMKVLQIGNSYMALVALITVLTPFYFIMIEEYYSGKFELGMFNPVSDGSLIIYFIFFFTAYVGTGWWDQRVTFNIF